MLEQSSSKSSSTARIVGAHMLVSLICSTPFFLTTIPGMIDHPHHIARYHIFTNIHKSDALKNIFYQEWSFVPNIGVDLLVLFFSSITGIDSVLVGHFITAVAIVSIVPAVGLLHYAWFRSWSYWTLSSAIIVFNYVVIYGFVNYVAGVAAAMAAAASWIILREHRAAVIIAVQSVMAFILMVIHLFGLGIYALIVFAHELTVLWNSRGRRIQTFCRQVVLSSHVVPAILTPLFLGSVDGGLSVDRIKMSTVRGKIIALYSVVDLGSPWIGILTAVIIGCVGLMWIFRRMIVVAPPGGVAVILLTMAFLAMPFTILGSGFADYRMPYAIAATCFAATRVTAHRRLDAWVVGVVIAMLAVVRIGYVSLAWFEGDKRYHDLLRGMAVIPVGSKVEVLFAAEDIDRRFLRQPPIDNVSGLAVWSRHAFVSNFFAEPGKQPITFRPEFAALARHQTFVRLYDPENDPLVSPRVDAFDVIMLFARTPLRREVPAHLHRLDDGSVAGLHIFQIRRPRALP